MARTVTPKPLTHDAFAPYGDVIDTGGDDVRRINEGHTQRFHNLANLDLTEDEGRASVNIFRSEPLELPIVIKIMERHPKSSQAFFPLGGDPYLVVVAPSGDLDPAKIEVFLASSNQGVNYHRGTWHHYSLATRKVSDFLVIDRLAKNEADDENCDEEILGDEEQLIIGDIG